MSEVKWTHERILEELRRHSWASQAMGAIRDDMQATIDELAQRINDLMGYYIGVVESKDAQLATRQAATPVGGGEGWEPLPDGMVYHYTEILPAEWNYPAHVESIEFLEVRDKGKVIACGTMPNEDEHAASLPYNIRLCRKRPPAQG